MANINAAFGLRPYVRSGSNYNNQGVNAYPLNFDSLTTGTTSLIWTGTPVIPLASGLIDVVGNANGGTVPLLGVFVGCRYIATDGTPTWSAYWPGYAAIKASTEATAFVADNPDALYVINADGALPDNALFANANFATSITAVTTSITAITTDRPPNTSFVTPRQPLDTCSPFLALCAMTLAV